jgi:adenosylcobinamide-GDP ribazoletransferase
VYFPLIGWLVGAVAAAVYWGAVHLWPPVVAVLLSTGASVLLTGAFHEDGLADVCDGFGGGWTRARILEIMKDSRVGTYGLVGLGLVLAIKVAALNSASTAAISVPVLLLVAHPLSRLTALTFIRTLPYARADLDDGKAKPVAQSMPNGRLAAAAVLGLAPLVALVLWRQQPALLWVLLPLLILQLVLGRWFRKWLGGYTGDCLGATQQLAEALIYLSLTVHLA